MNPVSTLPNALVERIKINRVWQETRDGRSFWFKARRKSAAPVLHVANRFFQGAGAPMRTIPRVSDWQDWEVSCFLGLHGDDGFRAFAPGERTIAAEELPGINVTVPLDNGSLTPELTAAAGAELRRAHGWICPTIEAPWSHGDPHAGNFIFDPAASRARIIDFEVRHDPLLSTDERHTDDVLVFLQDIVGRIRAEQWLPCARAFLGAYGRPEIIQHLWPQLQVPTFGLGWTWWRIRTSFLALPELRRRLSALKAASTQTAAPVPQV